MDKDESSIYRPARPRQPLGTVEAAFRQADPRLMPTAVRSPTRSGPCAPCRVGEFRRVEEFPLQRPRHPAHGALADLARLATRLELGRDLLQKLRSPALIDRPGQGQQNRHFLVVEL